jgi:proline dehydrogenase
LRRDGFDNVGVVLQSYLYRSKQDARDLMAASTRIRLVKGAYDEPPSVAYPKKADVNACFDRVTEILLEASAVGSAPAASADGRWPPIAAIATHDEKRIAFAKAHAQKIDLPKNKLEFQMLYGIRRRLQEELAADGYPVRVYVPYGTQWYPYFMRRLAERPANLWFFLSSFVRR